MARGGDGHPKVSLVPAIPYPTFTPTLPLYALRVVNLKTALWQFQGWLSAGQAAFSRHLPPWIPTHYAFELLYNHTMV